MTPRLSLAVALPLFAAGCFLLTEPGCDICTTSAVVQGTVSANGAAVAGAQVIAAVSISGCSETFIENFGPAASSGADGSYAVTVRAMLSPGERCVTLQIVPPTGSGLAARTDTVPALRLRDDSARPVRRDTLVRSLELVPLP